MCTNALWCGGGDGEDGEDGEDGSALQDRPPTLCLAVLTLPLKQDFCCPCLLSNLSWLSSGFNQPKHWNEPGKAVQQLRLPDYFVVPHSNLNITHEYCFPLGWMKIYFVLHVSGSGKSGLGGWFPVDPQWKVYGKLQEKGLSSSTAPSHWCGSAYVGLTEGLVGNSCSP